MANMQQSYPGINPSIFEWRGQEITDFQEELLVKVNAHISEKWFYNHIKSESKSLPRIDILNLLSKYVGYTNWDDFVFKNSDQVAQGKSVAKANRYFLILPLLLVVVMAILFLLFKLVSNREYTFSFYDAHTRETITGCQIEIKILSEEESPVNYLSGTTGSFVLKTGESVIKMVINAPYYKSDTITRILKTFERDQKISLQPNDYALIIHYFSEMNVDDWQKRRTYLGKIIDDGAMIYQVLNDINAPGMEMYNKDEFIDKLTMPTSSLKYI
ncbi:MAG: hypothetical protein K8R74_13440, partial [Bacteroidales bacterium]|nr:hypothetical protein [Bacteroidales bacterium]